MEDNEIHTKFFSLKVLTCIYDLQMGGDNMTNVNVSGITIDEIVEQMCRRFVTDGDVEAQVLISLKQICHKGLVGRVKDRYKLVGPMARILLMTHRNCERKRQIEKIQRIFFNNCVSNATATATTMATTTATATATTTMPRLRCCSNSQINKCRHKRSRSRTEEPDVPERPKRSRTKEIETRQQSKQSTRRNRSTRSKCSRESHGTQKFVIRDLVDFLQYDSSCTTSRSSLRTNESPQQDDIITLLPENKNYKCYQSECICNYGCSKSKSGVFSKK